MNNRTNSTEESESFFRDRIWARYEDVWRASDGVIDHVGVCVGLVENAKRALPKASGNVPEIGWK